MAADTGKDDRRGIREPRRLLLQPQRIEEDARHGKMRSNRKDRRLQSSAVDRGDGCEFRRADTGYVERLDRKRQHLGRRRPALAAEAEHVVPRRIEREIAHGNRRMRPARVVAAIAAWRGKCNKAV